MIDKIIAYIKQLWDAPFVQEFLLIAITAILTHFFETRKQRNEQKQRYLESVGSRISDALVCAREICEKTRIIEVFTTDGEIHVEDIKSTNALQDLPLYPGFMSNQESLSDFFDAVSEARSKHEPYLDLTSASYLYVLERYLVDLSVFAKNNDLHESLPFLGCAVIFDIQKWANAFDRHLVKQINKPHYQLFSRNGRCWKKAMGKAKKKFLEESELQKLLHGTSDFPISLGMNKDKREN